MTDTYIEPIAATPEVVLGEWERILLYGPSGVGKSFTAGTAPEPQWWLTPGGKNEAKTIFSPDFIKKHGKKEAFITSVTEDRKKGQFLDNPNGYDRCCHAVDSFLDWNEQKGAGVQTIIVDNATILEEFMMNKAIMAEYHMAGTTSKTVLAQERAYGIRKPHDSTYGGAQSLMDQWINWLRELPFHLVFIAHHYEVSEQISGTRERRVVSVRPLFVGQQRISVPNKFDNVWYGKVSGGGRSRVYGFQTQRNEIIEARSRVSLLDALQERDVDISEFITRAKEHAQSISQ